MKPDGSELLTRRKAKGERSTLVVDQREANVVLEVYDAYVRRRLGIATIANSLNSRCVQAPTSYRRIGPGTWTKVTLWAMLRSRIYVGVLVTGKARYSEIGRKRGKLRRPVSEHVVVEGAVPAILARDLWDAAQRRHGTRRFGTGRPWRSPYLLSTMIGCACGRHYQGKRTPAGVTYYVCGGRIATGPSVCSAPSVPTSYLDTAALDGVIKRVDLILQPGELRRRLGALIVQDTASADTVPDLTARLGETERRIGRLIEALAAGPDDLTSVRAALVELERERARLTRDLADARARAGCPPPIEAAVEAMLADLTTLPEILAAGDPEDRKRVIRSFLAGVAVARQGAGDAAMVIAAPEQACGNVGGGGGNRTHVRKPSAAGVYVDSRFILLLSRPSVLHPAGGPRGQPHLSRPSPEAKFWASHQNMMPVPRP